MNSKPINIVTIRKYYNKPSKYDLNFEALQRLLEPIKDKNVAVIPIVGPSRQGKSFMLNYMNRFLSDPKNVDWMGRGDEPLKGFCWKSDVDPQTFGIWLSKPYVLKQCNGNEIAVILMDTQGVFDDSSTQRDWSTIVGISLLVSSCLIFNVFTTLGEEILITLDSFIKYGLKAAETNAGANDKIPFQSLFFLIRDWNTPNQFKYGLTGGKQFLEKRLMVNEGQTEKARNVRQSIRKCFQDISCFLMPNIGNKIEEEEFNGCIDHLHERFQEKMKEFISKLLNPEEITPKMIDNTFITGDELCQYFKSYVQIFNNEDLPEPKDIMEATAKISNHIYIRKLKDLHFNDLMDFIHKKPFVGRKDLEIQNKANKTEIIELFESSTKASDSTLIDKLYDNFKKNYEIVFNTNEKRRIETMETNVAKCGSIFHENINKEMNNRFIESKYLEELFKLNEKFVFDIFRESFGGEDETLFDKDFLNLTKFINNSESAYRTENFRRIDLFENSKTEYVNDVIEYYNRRMEAIFETNVYITKEQFKQLELNTKTETEIYYKEKYNFGNLITNENFYLKIEQKLKESKIHFKQQNKIKCNYVLDNINEALKKSIEAYNKGMNEMFEIINSEDDLNKRHKTVSKKILKDFTKNCLHKDQDFLNAYINNISEQINKLFDNFRTQLNDRIERLHNKYKTPLAEAKDYYITEMNNSLENKGFHSSEDLNKINKKYRKSSILVYEQQFDNSIRRNDILYKTYLTELKESIDEEFDRIVEINDNLKDSEEKIVENKINELSLVFESRMNQIIESVNNERELVIKYNSLKEELMRELFILNNTITDMSLIQKSGHNFEKTLDNILNEYESKLNQRRVEVFNSYKSKVFETKSIYSQKIQYILENEEYILDEELTAFNENLKVELISHLKNQLRPAFDFNVESFVQELKQLIDEEYNHIFKNNELKRENQREILRNSSQTYVNEYEFSVCKTFESINSEEELQTNHNQLIEKIFENIKQSNTYTNKKLIDFQIAYIETEIIKLFNNFKSSLKEKRQQLDDSYKSKFSDAKLYYIQKMNDLFENKDFYSMEELNTLQEVLRKDTFNQFKVESNIYEDNSDKAFDSYSDKLNKFIDDSFIQYKQKNNENRESFKGDLRHKSNNVLCEYNQIMIKSFNSINNEEELDRKHYEVMEKLLSEFADYIHINDLNLLESYSKNLQKDMSKTLNEFKVKLNEKIEKIIESYKKKFTEAKAMYTEEMEAVLRTDQLYSDENIQELHKTNSSEAIDFFERFLKDHPCFETQTYFIKFKLTIDEEFNKFDEKFKLKRNLKEKSLEVMVNEFTEMYEQAMKPNLKIVDNKEELMDYHNKVRTEVIKVFSEMSQLQDTIHLGPYIEKIDENIDNSLLDLIQILEFQIDKRISLTKTLRLEVRKFYKKEMQQFLQKKFFVPKQILLKNSKIVMKNTIDRFLPQKADLTEENFVKLVNESIEDIFRKIRDENDSRIPTESQAIGIDLGTTNSCVAYFKPDRKNPYNVVVIPNELGRNTTPSVVSFRDESVLVVGDVAKDDIHVYHRNTITSAKRLIGRDFNDPSVQKDMKLWSYEVINDGNNNPKINVKTNGTEETYFPEQISAKVLKKMKEVAENHLGCEVTKAVITVPAYFNDAQKEATKDAGRLAGLEVLRIINEPTAAAIAFKIDRSEDTDSRKVLIYDFGGGTFDVAVLEIEGGNIEVKAVGGDNHLGGDDFDTNIIKFCLDEFRTKTGLTIEGQEGDEAMCRLRRKCEDNKIRLTCIESTDISIVNFYKSHDLNVILTRDKFEELNNELFVKSIDLVTKALEDANMTHSEINDIVLVGGSTRIPKIQEMLSHKFGGRPLNHSVNPDEAVAVGAAIQAAILNGQQSQGFNELTLSDVTPLSLGIRIKGGFMSVIIRRNSKVPTNYTKQYFTSEDNQTSVAISIFEGEHEMADDNHLLGQFDLNGIPSGPQGEQPIDVTFDLNDEGILHVIAKIVSTGGEQDIEISEHKGRLSKQVMEQLIAQGQ